MLRKINFRIISFLIITFLIYPKVSALPFEFKGTLRPQAAVQKSTEKQKTLKQRLADIVTNNQALRDTGDAIFGRAQTSFVDLGDHKQKLICADRPAGITVEEQTYSLLRDIGRALSLAGMDQSNVARQTVYLNDISMRDEVERLLEQFYEGAIPATDFVEQPPANGDHLIINVAAIGGRGTTVKRCSKYMTVVETGSLTWAYIGGVTPHAALKDTSLQAVDCFQTMADMLKAEGFDYANVLRTWLYERDIFGADPDGTERYEKLNKARTVFYTKGAPGDQPIRFGGSFDIVGTDGNGIGGHITLPPASTGIGIRSGSFVMGCVALMPSRNVSIQFLENPEQVSAFAYIPGADGLVGDTAPRFSRGLAVLIDGFKIIYASGTASIKGPKTIHIGDAAGQTKTTLDNIELVFKQAGATLKNAAQLVVYVKDPEDLEKVKKEVARRCPGIPCAYVIADVCRSNLLVEIEAIGFMKCPNQPQRMITEPAQRLPLNTI